MDLAKAHIVGPAGPPAPASLQTPPMDAFGLDVIIPRYDPAVWMNMLSQSARLNRAIRVMARNTVGLGFDIVPRVPEDEMSPGQRERFKRERDRAERFFERPSDDPMSSVNDILERSKIDEEGAGDGWIEVVRDVSGRPAALYHAATISTRLAASRTSAGRQKVIQATPSGLRRRWFVAYGDPTALDPATGEERPAPYGSRASEILHTAIYAPDDPWYGGPRYAAAAAAIMSSRLAKQWNVNLLRNTPHVPFAVIVDGAQLSGDSMDMVQAMLERNAKGIENAGRALLLQPDTQNMPPQHQNQAKVRLEKLAMGLDADGGFLKLDEANNEEIRESLGLAKIMLGTFTDANKSNAVIALRTTVQHEIEPDIRRREGWIDRTIVRDMGFKLCRFRLRRPEILDPLQTASVIQKLMSGFTLNEIRDMAGTMLGRRLPPIDQALANQPLGYFRDARLTAEADLFAGMIEKRLEEVAEAAGPAPASATLRSSVSSLLPLEFDMLPRNGDARSLH